MGRLKVLGLLTELFSILQKNNSSYAPVIEAAISKLRTASGLELSAAEAAVLRSLFGGMGTLNDVYIVIPKVDGQSDTEEKEVNGKISSLRKALWEEIQT